MTTYAQLDATQTNVVAIRSDIDPTLYAAWVSDGNPKATMIRVVTMTDAPVIDATTQAVSQNGWIITPADVKPNWVTRTLSAAEQTAATNQAARATFLNVAGTALNNVTPASFAGLNASQKDTLLLHLVRLNAILVAEQRQRLFSA